jgi:hypothetical protein
MQMGSLPERVVGPVSRPAAAPAGAQEEIRFVPARWLAILFAVIQLVLKRGALGKVGIAALLWSVAPRRLRLVAGGLAAAAAIVLLGALAAIALLVIQLG